MNRTGPFTPAERSYRRIDQVAALLCGLAFLLPVLPLAAQTQLKEIDFDAKLVDAKGAEPALHVDFMLPQPDAVSSLEVKIGGKAIGQDKVKFTPLDKAGGYKCAVLLLVDRALGSGKDLDEAAKARLQKSVRLVLDRLGAGVEKAPYQMAMAAFSGNMEVLAKMGSDKQTLDAAASLLQLDQASSELNRGLKAAMDWLSAIPADRRFIVVLTDANSTEGVVTQKDVLAAAKPGRIHVCAIGFPRAGAELQKLDPVAEQTGGYAVRAEGSDFNLPSDAEGQMLKFMLSGGKAVISLAGLHDTQNVEMKAVTESAKAYAFSAKAELPPPPPPPKPKEEEKPKEPEKPKVEKPKLVEPPKPQPPPTRWEAFQAQIKAHKGIAIGGGAAVVILFFALIFLLLRLRKKAPQETTVSDGMWNEIVAPQFTGDGAPPPLPPEEPVLAWLISLDADQTRHPLRRTAVRLGRKPDNDIILKNDSVSSHHAEIVKRGQNFVIADLEASNGIFVNGKRVEKTNLANDDMIELGEVRFRFQLNNPDA
jgi:hypothetical protein